MSKFEQGQIASYRYCHQNRIVRIIDAIPDSAGRANDPLIRIDMDGKKMAVRQSELRPMIRIALSDEQRISG